MRMLIPISSNLTWPSRKLSSDYFEDAMDDFDRIVDSFLRPTIANTVNFQPSCDVNETKDQYLVSFDMPGIKRNDIKIEVQGNQLVISGVRHREASPENSESALRHERMYGKFERSFSIPESIDADKIEAHYEDGVLNVALPKVEVKKGRTIQIQSGQGNFLSKLLGSKKEGAKELKDVKVS